METTDIPTQLRPAQLTTPPAQIFQHFYTFVNQGNILRKIGEMWGIIGNLISIFRVLIDPSPKLSTSKSDFLIFVMLMLFGVNTKIIK